MKLKFPVEEITIKDENCLFCGMVKGAIDRYGDERFDLEVVQLARVPEDIADALITRSYNASRHDRGAGRTDHPCVGSRFESKRKTASEQHSRLHYR